MAGGCVFVAFQVNEKAVRLTAFFTVLLIGIFLYSRENWILYGLTADFFIRGFIKPSFSPLSFVSRAVLSAVRVKARLMNAGPKIFAAKIGFTFCVLMTALEFFRLPVWTDVAGAVLIICAALEAFLGFCVGCRVHALLFPGKKSVDFNI